MDRIRRPTSGLAGGLLVSKQLREPPGHRLALPHHQKICRDAQRGAAPRGGSSAARRGSWAPASPSSPCLAMSSAVDRRNKQVWEAIDANNFKQALQLCLRRIKKGEQGDYLHV